MSSGPACCCSERREPLCSRRWVVRVRKANRSAFSGYHWTPSEWSEVKCLRCGALWRTRAAYVSELRDE